MTLGLVTSVTGGLVANGAIVSITQVQAYPQSHWGFCLDHRNEVNITIRQVTQYFWLPSAYESYVYTTLSSIKCAIALCLKKNVHIFIEKYCIAENC